VLLKVPPVATALGYLNHAVSALSTATGQGTAFVFGYVGGAPLPRWTYTVPPLVGALLWPVVTLVIQWSQRPLPSSTAL